jgi:hypothetical protein
MNVALSFRAQSSKTRSLVSTARLKIGMVKALIATSPFYK